MLIPCTLLRDPKFLSLKNSERLILFALIARANEGCCWPSVNTLSTDTDLSTRVIYRGLAQLELSGLIQIERTVGLANKYRIVPLSSASPLTETLGVPLSSASPLTETLGVPLSSASPHPCRLRHPTPSVCVTLTDKEQIREEEEEEDPVAPLPSPPIAPLENPGPGAPLPQKTPTTQIGSGFNVGGYRPWDTDRRYQQLLKILPEPVRYPQDHQRAYPLFIGALKSTPLNEILLAAQGYRNLVESGNVERIKPVQYWLLDDGHLQDYPKLRKITQAELVKKDITETVKNWRAKRGTHETIV